MVNRVSLERAARASPPAIARGNIVGDAAALQRKRSMGEIVQTLPNLAVLYLAQMSAQRRDHRERGALARV
jgi:hypothetical protein